MHKCISENSSLPQHTRENVFLNQLFLLQVEEKLIEKFTDKKGGGGEDTFQRLE